MEGSKGGKVGDIYNILNNKKKLINNKKEEKKNLLGMSVKTFHQLIFEMS